MRWRREVAAKRETEREERNQSGCRWEKEKIREKKMGGGKDERVGV